MEISGDGEELLEEKNKVSDNNQQKTIDSSQFENNMEDIIPLENENPSEQKPTNSEEKSNLEEKNITVDIDEETNGLRSTKSQEVNEDPRRKRRRSSASS